MAPPPWSWRRCAGSPHPQLPPNYGVIFSVQTDGTAYSLLREFAGGVDDGAFPIGSLSLSDSTLYGITNTDSN